MYDADSYVGDQPTYIITLKKADGTPRDVSTALNKKVRLKKPSGGFVELAASFVGDGTDGQISADAVDGTQDEAGTYEIQGYVEMNNRPYHSDISTFIVGPALKT